jgi:hypothetical protein
MYPNRISAALEGHASLAQQGAPPAASPDPSAFAVVPGGLIPGALQMQIYQASYERARAAVQQQAAAARRFAFSLN